MRLISPKTALKKWKSLPKEQQNSKNARLHAAMCGMKSMAEVETAVLLVNKGLGYTYEPETWEYRYEVQHYTPDFKVTEDSNLFIEVKGKATRETRNKLLAVKKCNPEKVIVLRFLRGVNKIRAGSKTSYLDWFKKKGFVCFDWHETKEFIEFIQDYIRINYQHKKKDKKGLKGLK